MKEYTTGELSRLFKSVGFSKVASYIGARGCYVQFPQFALRILESLLSALPYALRTRIGRAVPLRLFLEIRMVGLK